MAAYRRKASMVEAEVANFIRYLPGVVTLSKLSNEQQIAVKANFLPRIGGVEEAKGAIKTNHGYIPVCVGDYVIYSPNGAIHAAPPVVFFENYEPVDVEREIEKDIHHNVNKAIDAHSIKR